MDTVIEKVNEYLQQATFNFDVAGLACGVRVGADSPLACAGLDAEFAHGYADFEAELPLDASDAFHFASVSKLFVASAVMRLANTGQINLDEPLVKYLPDFRLADELYTQITPRHILSHTSGIPDIEDYHWRRPETDRDALRHYALSDEVRELKLLWEPGSGHFKYSNIAYDVIGAALESITGKSFEMLMADLFFAPLGMRDTTYFTPLREYGGPRLVKPHYKDEENHIRVQDYFPYNRAHAPSSTLTSTLRDIKKFGDVWIAMSSESPDNEVLRPQADVPGGSEKIGLGWFIRTQSGYTLYGHEGSDDGFRSSFWICPELSLQYTVLSNQDRAPVKKIGKRVFELLTERKESEL
jgi:CubicO group peptidase (beta-lactamase class C family)